MMEIYSQNINGTWFAIACTKQQIITTSFGATQKSTLKSILAAIPFNMPFQVFHEPTIFAKSTISTMKDVYNGKEVNTNLSFATTNLPAYTQKVLKATSAIPLGYVTSYGAIAKAVGGGSRAVGNIMAANPFSPIVPCHRVVRADFTLGGYGGGLKVKVELLAREKRGFVSSKEVEVNGRRLTVFPVEYVLRDLA